MDPTHRSSAMSAVHRVRAAWSNAAPGTAPDLASLLGRGPPCIEAIIADAEHRWDRGLPATLDHYATILPHAAIDAPLRRALLMCEVSRQDHQPIDALRAQLLARHPEHADEIEPVLAMASLMRQAAGTLSDDIELHPGDTLAKYQLVRRLGAGSFGEVWQARDTELDRYVALKLLFTIAPAPDEPGGATELRSGSLRFIAEARAAAALDHDHIVAVHHAGRFGENATPAARGRGYIDSQLVGDPAPTADDPINVRLGRSLEDGLDPALGLQPRAREAARIVEAIARAVAAAHAHGILHRDLKPANILITPSGRPMVADFGLSLSGILPREVADEPLSPPKAIHSVVLTSESGRRIVGTPAYMAPEQARGDPATPLTDVFALGAILRFLLTGLAPYSPSGRFSSDAREDVIAQARDAVRARLRETHPALPRTLAAIADRAMAANPAERYVSAEQLAADLRAWLTHRPTLADRPSTPRTLALWYRRNALPATIAVAAVLVIGIGTTRFIQRLATERDRARDAEILANQRRIEAEQARDATAAVNQFMQEAMFLSAAAKVGERITVNDMLTSAIRRVGTAFAGKPVIEASVRHAIGSGLLRFGSFDQTSEQLNTAIRLRTEHLGADHPDTLRSRVLLARAEFLARRDTHAERELDQLIPLCERSLGPEAEETCMAIQTLGRIHEQSNRPESAERLMRLAATRAEAGLGIDHARTLDALSDLYNLLSNQQRLEEALVVAARVVEARTRALGPDDYQTLTTRIAIANMLRRSGRYPEAERELRLAYDGLRTTIGPVNRSTITAGLQITELLLDELNRPSEALALALEAEKNRPRGSREPLNTQAVLCVARALVAMGDQPAAIQRATDLFNAMCLDPGPDSFGAVSAARFLADLHEQRAETELAIRYRQHLREHAPATRP